MAIITISRGSFTGAEALAERLSRELEYGLLTREELLTNTAEQFHALPSQLESALTHAPGLLEGRGLKKLHYISCVQAALAKAVRSDNVVYLGEAGHLLLKGIPHNLSVSVVADVESRVERAMEECNLTRIKALEYVRALDDKRDYWLKWVYGVDAKDPSTYDLTINLQHVPIPSACAIIAETAGRDFQTTPESQRLMDDLVVVSEIKAQIGLDRNIADDRIEVEAEDGVVIITANVRHLSSAEKARQLALQIPGVQEVQAREVTEL